MKFRIFLAAMCFIALSSGCSTIGKDPSQKYLGNIASTYDLPADPGRLADKTLEGVDENENGVRDEIERDLYLLYDVLNHKEYYPELIEYELNVARAFEAHLVSDDPVKSSENAIVAVQELRDYVTKTNDEYYRDYVEVPALSYLPPQEAAWIAHNLKRYVFDTPPRKLQLELQAKAIEESKKEQE